MLYPKIAIPLLMIWTVSSLVNISMLSLAQAKSPSVTLEQGLSCLDWAQPPSSAFYQQLAMNEAISPGGAKLLQQFKQQYRQQKSKVIHADEEDDCEDCPYTAVYVPKAKHSVIQKIETRHQISAAGAEILIYRHDDLVSTVKKLEQTLNIKFSHYTAQQIKAYEKGYEALRIEDKLTDQYVKPLLSRYPHLEVFNGAVFKNNTLYIPQQLYIYSHSDPVKDEDNGHTLTAYVSVYSDPLHPAQHILACGYQ